MKRASSIAAILALMSNLLVTAAHDRQPPFLIPSFKTTWHRAVDYCNSVGMRLVEIGDKNKEIQLKWEMQASNIYNDTVWIGANDLVQEGNWHWHGSGKKVVFLNWGSNQPDNGGQGEYCVEFGNAKHHQWNMEWQWNDCPCDANRNVACEHY